VVEDPDTTDEERKQSESPLSSRGSQIARRLRNVCTRKTLYKRLPILNWLARYNGQDALGDLVAGVTVGLTVIPQSLAYSNVAGLPPQVHSFNDVKLSDLR
jgi:sodium-independent sulfate anion transporter 11